MEIRTWVQLKNAARRYAALAREIQEAELELSEQLDRAREEHSRAVGKRLARSRELEAALRRFAESNKSEFQPEPEGPGRSRSFHGVEIGFRRTPPAAGLDDCEEATRWLEKVFGERFIRLTTEADRDALKAALSNGNRRLVRRLNQHGITLNQTDKFYVDVEHA